MRCITIQHKSVLERLLKNGYYIKDLLPKDNLSDLDKAYLYMKDVYHYENMPIFLAPEGYKVEFYGAEFYQNSVAIELDIPAEYLKIQKYYDWSDFIYFIGEEKEFHSGGCKYKNVYDYGSDVLLAITHQTQMNKTDAFQLTTEMLKKEWVLSTANNIRKIAEKHNGSGGNFVLKALNDYVR